MTENSLLNTIIVLVIILVIWFLLRLLFRKLVEPHKVLIYGPGDKSSANLLGYLSAEKKSSAFDTILVDENRVNNKEVAELFISEDQNSIEFRNLLLIDNSGSTSNQMDDYKKALKSFITTRFQNEKNALFTFSDTLQKMCDFTDSVDTLYNAIDSIQPQGATAMNDALIAAADLIASQEILKKEENRTIFYNIILFSDGLDNISQADKEDVKQRLEGRTIFIACTNETDLPLMYELAKNPHNVFIIGSTSTTPNGGLSNTSSASLEEALLKIRNEKMKGRGTVGYVRMRDGHNQFKTRGFVNVLGEIYSCGSSGEGAFFRGLCELPGSFVTKVYLGNYIDGSRTNEDYNIDASGEFGLNKSTIPVSPAALAGGAWVIYQLNKVDEKRARPESVMNAFPKIALLSLLIWSPIFLVYWFLKSIADFNMFGWLGKEFDITLTQILLFIVVWSLLSSLYADLLRRKKRFMMFNDAVNNSIGTNRLSKIIISLCAIGIVLSVFAFYPFSYAAFFVCVLIAFSANQFLNHGGGKTWFINTENPDFIRPFYENNTDSAMKVILDFEYETAGGKIESAKFEVRSSGNTDTYDTIKEAVLTVADKSIIDYLENCVHVLSIEKNYDLLSEAKVLIAMGCLSQKVIVEEPTRYFSSAEILLKTEVSLADKLILILSLLKEAAHEVVYSEDLKSLGFRTPNSLNDSPFIFEFETKYFYHFRYSDKDNSYKLEEIKRGEVDNWINI